MVQVGWCDPWDVDAMTQRGWVGGWWWVIQHNTLPRKGDTAPLRTAPTHPRVLWHHPSSLGGCSVSAGATGLC